MWSFTWSWIPLSHVIETSPSTCRRTMSWEPLWAMWEDWEELWELQPLSREKPEVFLVHQLLSCSLHGWSNWRQHPRQDGRGPGQSLWRCCRSWPRCPQARDFLSRHLRIWTPPASSLPSPQLPPKGKCPIHPRSLQFLQERREEEEASAKYRMSKRKK